MKSIHSQIHVGTLAFFIPFFLWYSSSSAQTINPQYISISDGLSSTDVQAIHQDGFGLLWVGTTNGLQKYDGTSFKTYKPIPGDPNSLIDPVILGLVEDHENNIWIASISAISKYDRETDSFVNYTFDGQDIVTIILFTDSQNRLWAGTRFAGLLRYDPGSDTWKEAQYQTNDLQELTSHARLIAIAEDQEGNIWVGNTELGLYYLPAGDSLFKAAPMAPSVTLDFTDLQNQISYLYADSTNTLWVATLNGIYKYYPKNGHVKTIREYDFDSDYFPGLWNNIRPDDDGNIWIANNSRGILKFEGISDQYQEISIAGVNPLRDGEYSFTITDFKIDNSGIFWFGTNSRGLIKYDPKKNLFKYYAHDETREDALSGNGTFSILKSDVRPETIYAGTNGGGLNILNREKETFRHIIYENVNDIYGGSVRSIAENSDGSLWLGTWGDGLIQTDSNYREINRFTKNAGSLTGLTDNFIRVLKKHPNGDLWVGSNQGLSILEAGTNQIKQIQSMLLRVYPGPLYELVNNLLASEPLVASMDEVKNDEDLTQAVDIEQAGEYLVIATGEGLPGEYLGIATGEGTEGNMYDYGWIENGEGETIWSAGNLYDSFHNGGSVKNRVFIDHLSLDSGTINLRYISDDSHSFNSWNDDPPTHTSLWGIALIKIADSQTRDHIQQYLQQSFERMYMQGISIQDIQFDNDIVWIGTYNYGLTKIQLSTNSVKTYTHKPGVETSISSNSIFDIYQEPGGVLWLATQEGLNRFNPETEIFTHYTEKDGLPTKFIESVLPGENGGLWISTQSGLSKMIDSESIKEVTFINYTAADGLGGETFFARVAEKTEDDTYFFGGEHGLTEFTNIQTNLVPPRMYISDLKISNKSVLEMEKDSPVNGSFFNTDKITLSYNQNDLSFDFIALHYANPEKNQYAHMLERFDDSWIYDNRNFASYTNLEPGEYTFRVRGSNSDGIWNEEGRSIAILITPPWWKTVPAYIAYVLLIIGGVFAVDRMQRRRLIRKERERAREKELEHAKEIEQAYKNLKAAQEQLVQQEKLASLGQLTAGIAHEIKNPLNFVNNFSDLSIELVEEAREEVKRQKAKGKGEKKSPFEGGKVGKANQGHDPGLILEILDDIEANLRKIHEHGSRADSIVKSMLQHSRGGNNKMEPTDVNALIKEYANLAFHGMRASKNPINVDIDLQLDENLKEIPLIAENFSRVILNLCNNAFDAMREKLSALSSQQSADSPFEGDSGDGSSNEYNPKLTIRTHRNDQAVTVEIEDNGPGIPDDIKDKILQPFFTTKKGTDGTGLGLSITNDIIKAHGGALEVYSKEDGTTMSVILNLS